MTTLLVSAGPLGLFFPGAAALAEHIRRRRLMPLLHKALNSADRVVIASDTLLGAAGPAAIGNARSSEVIEWQRGRLPPDVEHAPSQLTRPTTDVLTYTAGSAEIQLSAIVETIVGSLTSGHAPLIPCGDRVRRALSSSPAALEAELRKLTTPPDQRVARALQPLGTLTSFDDANPSLCSSDVASIARQALSLVETIEQDAKLIKLVDTLSSARLDPTSCLVVATDFPDTAYYVSEALAAIGFQPLPLATGPATWPAASQPAAAKGMCVVATGDALASLDQTPEVSELILYDLPVSFSALQQVLDRVRPPAKASALRVCLIAPTSAASLATSMAHYIASGDTQSLIRLADGEGHVSR